MWSAKTLTDIRYSSSQASSLRAEQPLWHRPYLFYGLVQQFNPITFPVPPGITAIYFATVNLGGDATGWFASFYGTPESLPCSVVPLLGSEGYVNKVRAAYRSAGRGPRCA